MKHTILGAGGSIGNALTYELLKAKQEVRLVSRSNFSIPEAESYKADITSYEQTLKSIQGSDVIYLCVGLPYNSTIWTELWPKIMKNTIDASKSVGAKLVFFDNVYMYGRVEGKMTEWTPYNPCSKKGEIRARVSAMLEYEIKQRNINAIIARAADLYGPYSTKTSMPYILAISKMIKGKKPQWMINADKLHSYSFTIDCAKGLKLLAENDDCFNQVWHLPTYNPGITGKQFIEITARVLGLKNNYSLLGKGMIKLAGAFDRTIREINEMTYQYAFDYYFDSEKFNSHFMYQPVSYEAGIAETIQFLRRN